MTHLPEIWLCIKNTLKKGEWTNIEKTYNLVQNSLSLDAEDFQPQSPSLAIPKWKRNVRNVLQYRKKNGKLNGMVKLTTEYNQKIKHITMQWNRRQKPGGFCASHRNR